MAMIPYTTREASAKFVEHVSDMVDYWDGLAAKTPREKLHGLAFSILVALDGEAASLPGYLVIPNVTKDDAEFMHGIGERWYPATSKDNPMDIAWITT